MQVDRTTAAIVDVMVAVWYHGGEVDVMGKVRTQIQLDPQDHALLKSFAERHRLSMAAAVRMLIQQALGDERGSLDDRWEAFLRVDGIGRDREGKRNVARQHDAYLYGGA